MDYAYSATAGLMEQRTQRRYAWFAALNTRMTRNKRDFRIDSCARNSAACLLSCLKLLTSCIAVAVVHQKCLISANFQTKPDFTTICRFNYNLNQALRRQAYFTSTLPPKFVQTAVFRRPANALYFACIVSCRDCDFRTRTPDGSVATLPACAALAHAVK